MLTVGSLFSGIGGFDLGLERAGMRTAWFVEQDEFCQRVLAKHWPGVPVYGDVRHVHHGRRSRCVNCLDPVDVLCGGFPCQDVSVAGRGAGLDGARSGLWREYARLVGDLRPRYVVVENVAALLGRGLGTVLGDLAALGYDAEWDCLPASAFGAPHRRDRVWIVAYPQRPGLEGHRDRSLRTGPVAGGREGAQLADAESQRREPRPRPRDPLPAGQPQALEPEGCAALSPAAGRRADHWAVEPDVGRVAHGVPARVDRLKSLGNALVPQIAEWIGRRILEWEAGAVTDERQAA